MTSFQKCLRLAGGKLWTPPAGQPTDLQISKLSLIKVVTMELGAAIGATLNLHFKLCIKLRNFVENNSPVLIRP